MARALKGFSKFTIVVKLRRIEISRVTIVEMATIPTQTSLSERSVPIIRATHKGIGGLVRKLAIKTAVNVHLVASIAIVIAHCSSSALKLGQQRLELKMKCRPH